MGTERQITVKQTPYSLHELYDKYAGMLLGYINGIVNDAKVAEQQLVSIFADLPLHELNAPENNTWCHLQRLAQKHLADLYEGQERGLKPDSIDLSNYYNRNKFLGLMNDEQKVIFCSVYYKGKTTAQLSGELGRTEESIRKELKDAFLIIRKGS